MAPRRRVPLPPAPVPRRLEAVAALVPPQARAVADIGYDHGKLLATLATAPHRVHEQLVGVEAQPGHDARFWELQGPALSAAPPVTWERLTLLHGDGLAPVAEAGLRVDVAVCAGLGERTMLGVLDAEAAAPVGLQRLVACPSHLDGELRPGLRARGFRVVDERVAFDKGRWYLALAAEREALLHDPHEAHTEGTPEPLEADVDVPPAMRPWAPVLHRRRDPALGAYLESMRLAFSRAFATDLAGYRDRATGELLPLGRKLATLDEAIALAAEYRAQAPD